MTTNKMFLKNNLLKKKVRNLELWADQYGIIYTKDGTKLEMFRNESCKNYLSVFFGWRWYFVHRLVYWAWHHEVKIPPHYGAVDHINKEASDNRPTNLRMLSNSLNNLNRHFKGYTTTRGLRFRARLRFDKATYDLGCFRSATKASFVYNKVKQKVFDHIYQKESELLKKVPLSKNEVIVFLNDAKANFVEKHRRSSRTFPTPIISVET